MSESTHVGPGVGTRDAPAALKVWATRPGQQLATAVAGSLGRCAVRGQVPPRARRARGFEYPLADDEQPRRIAISRFRRYACLRNLRCRVCAAHMAAWPGPHGKATGGCGLSPSCRALKGGVQPVRQWPVDDRTGQPVQPGRQQCVPLGGLVVGISNTRGQLHGSAAVDHASQCSPWRRLPLTGSANSPASSQGQGRCLQCAARTA